ncbi:hypothetical protein GCM10025868_22280 [Angustibacter aerolatus]|uniref:SHSP domain-containing protein n=1 Tax=Angustibacter aerolatus TaxID=1162965 RepID=A0ABQ6JFL6_9ACTN|nr:Hsp20/alpha crystallin family protein [Angustibacter aerolatus]GMA86978.1 hypothetical protein GCM10025868_22280 [Angustibacter aerolatus]
MTTPSSASSLPGVDVERDVTVELDRGRLVVSGERRDERAGQRGRSLGEVRYGRFTRAFTLPEHVTGESLTATYDAGVLSVRVAGAHVGREPQRVSISVGQPADVRSDAQPEGEQVDQA